MSNKTRCDVLEKQMFLTWMKTLLHCVWLNSCKSDDLQTNAFSTSEKFRSHGKHIFFLLVTIVATSQEMKINVYFILISGSSPYVLSYRSIYSQVNIVGNFSKVLIEILFTNS